MLNEAGMLLLAGNGNGDNMLMLSVSEGFVRQTIVVPENVALIELVPVFDRVIMPVALPGADETSSTDVSGMLKAPKAKLALIRMIKVAINNMLFFIFKPPFGWLICLLYKPFCF